MVADPNEIVFADEGIIFELMTISLLASVVILVVLFIKSLRTDCTFPFTFLIYKSLLNETSPDATNLPFNDKSSLIIN